MRTEFTTPITTLEEAHAFLTYLHEQGLSFHPEDSAADCIGDQITQEEAREIDNRHAEAYRLEWPEGECPCSFLLNLDPEYKARRLQEEAEEAEAAADWDRNP